jgi:hypothetical protein
MNAPWGSSANIIRVDPPAIALQPSGAIVKPGGSTNFSVTATGTNLSYQWKRNGADLAGEMGATLSLNNLQSTQAGFYTVVVSNSVGSVTSNVVQLTVVIPPNITSQPAAATANQGASVTFIVTTTGTNLSYQWKRNGADLAGQTGAQLLLNNLQGTQAGSYTVVVSNAIGSETSTAAQLAVVIPPGITVQPVAATANQGASTSFNVTATGTNLSYQWKRNGADLAGETGATLSINNLQGTQTGNYTVAVSNAIGSETSTAAQLTVVIPPRITAQPAAATANQGASASFSVTATGTNLSYQWKRNGADLAGETGAQLFLNNLQGTQAGSYTAVVSNSAKSVTSNDAQLAVVIPPSITAQPAAATANQGASASFSVTATGTNLSYQWKRNGADLAGQTGDTLVLDNLHGTRTGFYTVAVSNAIGSVTSDDALLTVVIPPAITAQPAAVTANQGGNATLSVTATGTNLGYHWTRNGADLTGEMGATLVFNNLQVSQAGSYTVAVWNSAGIVTSAAAQLTVEVPPTITAQPADVTFNQGGSGSFHVTATGTNLSYQWKRNGADLAGETGAMLSLNNLQGTQAGSYTVAVSNSAGSVTSNAAVLTILGITSSLDRLTLNVGNLMSYAVTANPAPTTYAAKSLPAGLKINAKTGVIFGKPTKAGEYTVTLQALRKGAPTLSAVKTLRVLQAPTFKLPAKVNVTRNKAFRSAPKVSAYPTASFSVFSGDLPEGITLNPTTGQISGKTVTLKGNYAVTIRGSNEAGKTDVKTVLVVK